ncbi:MAG: N-acetylglucosamine-6-phosphate deacetylase [Opitutaceae bacterium]|nr:N-acetylglucosamine-6-phosphate deacetylase [Opitutaceae bacterium]
MNSPAPLPPPRWFDFQVNGFAGVDFQAQHVSLAELERAVAGLRRHGVAAIFLTLITDTIDEHCRRLEQFEKHRAASPACAQMIAGYHIEGPWLSPEAGYRGAHPAEPMHAPSLAEFERLQAAARGQIRLITLAPEWPGSAECIAAITRAGVHISLGHTNASEADIDAAIRAGARFATHVGNGAPLTLHRHDNIIQRLLARDELTACFIPDGVHLPPFVLKNFVRTKPAGKVLFTTDAMAGAGCGPGRYRIGRFEIAVGTDGIARQPGGGGFAGSTLTPDAGVQRTANYLGLPLETAAHLWSAAAAHAFGITLPAHSNS